MNELLIQLAEQLDDLADEMILNADVLAESDPSEIDDLLDKLKYAENILNSIQLDNHDD